jgi:hypothetical protein
MPDAKTLHGHEPLWGPWEERPKEGMWYRYCQVVGCEFAQATSVNPRAPLSPWDAAMNKAVGIK